MGWTEGTWLSHTSVTAAGRQTEGEWEPQSRAPPLPPLWTQSCSDIAARHDGHLCWGQEVWFWVRSRKEHVPSSHPTSSAPYSTFWIPLGGDSLQRCCQPQGGEGDWGRAHMGAMMCPQVGVRWAYEQEGSRLWFLWVTFFFFLTQYNFSYDKSEPLYSQDCFKNQSNSYIRGFGGNHAAKQFQLLVFFRRK